MQPEVGIRVLREVGTVEELGEARALAPVRPDDLVATADAVYRVVSVLPLPRDAACSPVLVRRARLTPGTS